MDTIFDGEVPRARLALLLRHFSELKDNREPWRIVYPLQEVLLLVTCATIASCDDFDDIVAWGKHHLVFLRHFSEFHHGIPCERWLRALLNRIDPILFGRCFNSWIAALWPNRHEFIAIDGKTSRRTHDQRKGLKALHTLSAYATHARLTLAQLSVPEKTNEITAIPDLLDQLAETKQLEGALVTIDAMGCQTFMSFGRPISLWTAPAPTGSHWWGPLTEVVRRGPRPSLLPLFRHAGLRIIAARIDRCAHIARRKSCFDHFELKPILASSVTGGGQMRPRDFIKAGSKPAMFEGRKVEIRLGGGPKRSITALAADLLPRP